MVGVLSTYLVIAGGIGAAAQLGRGVARGMFRLFQRDPRGALAEVAGGLAAPAVTAAQQMFALGQEVAHSAVSLMVGNREAPESEDVPSAPRFRSRRHRIPATTAHGAA